MARRPEESRGAVAKLGPELVGVGEDGGGAGVDGAVGAEEER